MFRITSLFAALLFAVATTLFAATVETSSQKSSAGGVTVAVTPDLSSNETWAFKVVLDTHSQDLSDDLVKTATLLDSAGNRYKPLSWQGAGPGGHHREGVLRFPAVTPLPLAVELQLQRANESAVRSFRWQLQ